MGLTDYNNHIAGDLPDESEDLLCPFCGSPLEESIEGFYFCSDIGNNNCKYVD